MAVFKPLMGNRASLRTIEKHAGYMYFCVDDGSLHLDYTDADGNLQRKQINAKDAETLCGASLSELQSDWSINDPADPAYIKNRTHWMETEYVTFIDNEIMEFASFNEIFTTDRIENDVVLIEGNTYTFTIDGTAYDCVAHLLTDSGYTCLGNLSFFDDSLEDTLESFCVVCYNNAEISTMLLAHSGIQFATTLEGTSHVISLSGYVPRYHKIDEKYLPQLIGRPGENVGSEVFNDYENNIADGAYTHAEGSWTTASGDSAHAEGTSTTASGDYSHAEGCLTTASGDRAHAEGQETQAIGRMSHAEGNCTTANSLSQHVQGEYNIVDTDGGVYTRGKYAHIVGNGTAYDACSNAHTLDWDGNAWFAGDVKVGGTGQDDANASKLATENYVDAIIASMKPKSTTVTIPAANWTGNANPWSQVVSINGVTENSKVDLQPTAQQIVALQDAEVSIMLQNESGVITAWAIGKKPTVGYTFDVLITEVSVI